MEESQQEQLERVKAILRTEGFYVTAKMLEREIESRTTVCQSSCPAESYPSSTNTPINTKSAYKAAEPTVISLAANNENLHINHKSNLSKCFICSGKLENLNPDLEEGEIEDEFDNDDDPGYYCTLVPNQAYFYTHHIQSSLSSELEGLALSAYSSARAKSQDYRKHINYSPSEKIQQIQADLPDMLNQTDNLQTIASSESYNQDDKAGAILLMEPVNPKNLEAEHNLFCEIPPLQCEKSAGNSSNVSTKKLPGLIHEPSLAANFNNNHANSLKKEYLSNINFDDAQLFFETPAADDSPTPHSSTFPNKNAPDEGSSQLEVQDGVSLGSHMAEMMNNLDASLSFSMQHTQGTATLKSSEDIDTPMLRQTPNCFECVNSNNKDDDLMDMETIKKACKDIVTDEQHAASDPDDVIQDYLFADTSEPVTPKFNCGSTRSNMSGFSFPVTPASEAPTLSKTVGNVFDSWPTIHGAKKSQSRTCRSRTHVDGASFDGSATSYEYDTDEGNLSHTDLSIAKTSSAIQKDKSLASQDTPDLCSNTSKVHKADSFAVGSFSSTLKPEDLVNLGNKDSSSKEKNDRLANYLSHISINKPSLLSENCATDTFFEHPGCKDSDLESPLSNGEIEKKFQATTENNLQWPATGYHYDKQHFKETYDVLKLKIVRRKNQTGIQANASISLHVNDIVAGRYQVVSYLGSAAFSMAVQALDLKKNIMVCLKIIKNNKDYFDQSLDEIMLLKYVNWKDSDDSKGILRLYDYFYYKEHLFLVCELLRANLFQFLCYNLKSEGERYFSLPRVQSIASQVLRSLAFLHSLDLVHCDLKPENILIKSFSKCQVKVIDLGSSCFTADCYSSYVQSRCYRSPEVLLGLPYSQAIDVWSLGCIIAELLHGKLLFRNESVAGMLARMEGILGKFPPWMLQEGKHTNRYFTKDGLHYCKNAKKQFEILHPKKSSLAFRVPQADELCLSFISSLLSIDPNERPSAEQALQHPWLQFSYEASQPSNSLTD